MNITDFAKTYYCLYLKNNNGEEQMYLQKDITPDSTRYQIHLFEGEETLLNWIKQEQEIQALNERWGTYKLYDRLYSKKIYITEFSTLLKEKEEIYRDTVILESSVIRINVS